MIAYLTHDEVNAAVARRAARRLCGRLKVLGVKDADRAAAADLVLLDLDHLPPECKLGLLRQAVGGELANRFAVHSYQLSTADERVLRAAGVRVATRLTAALLAVPALESAGGPAPQPV